ncbi:MAG: ABC transporter permease [Chloroflexota bacterium]
MRTVNAVSAIAFRDLVKFLRNRARIVGTFIFPIVIIAALGGSLQSNLGRSLGYDFLTFTFTGIFAQTVFQSASFGIISLLEDRDNDFTQEMFVAPISRYAIILGKITGESLVALAQAAGITAFAVVLGVGMTPTRAVALLPVALVSCLLGGSFGIALLGGLSSQRAANQLFPFVFLPQFFLAGVFNPIRKLPIYLDVLSHLSPLRYAVDLTRGLFYSGSPAYDRVVLSPPVFNFTVASIMFLLFMGVGTSIFVRQERNR